MNVVLLSNSKEHIDAVRAAAKRKRLTCTVIDADEHASATIRQKSNEGIVVVDAEASLDFIRLLHTRLPAWPILVLSSRFDSSAWVELFKAGASEVIGVPLNPGKLDAALDGFVHAPESGGLWDRLVRRLGVR